uniref:Uncharacterized protein n=1 Tax=Anguilla anguilla TaxID=7936 RepID=A0A0E9TB85_ANGAN
MLDCWKSFDMFCHNYLSYVLILRPPSNFKDEYI